MKVFKFIIKFKKEKAVDLLLIVVLLSVGACFGCRGVTNESQVDRIDKSGESKSESYHKRQALDYSVKNAGKEDKGISEDETSFRQNIFRPSQDNKKKPGLTASTSLYDLYYFDSLSKYENPIEKVRLDLKSKEDRSIYPLKHLRYFKENIVRILEAKSAGSRSNQHYYIVDTGKEREEQAHIAIFYRGHHMVINLVHYEISGFSDVHNVVTESVFFDTLGNEIVHILREDEVANVSISSNGKYAFINSGGWYTEDTFFPYRFALFNIEKQEFEIEKVFLQDCVRGSEFGKGYFRLALMESCDNLKNNITLFYDFQEHQWYFYDSEDCINNIGVNKRGAYVCFSRNFDKQVIVEPDTDFLPIEDPMTYINLLK